MAEESAVFVDPLAPAAIATGIHSELNEYRSQSLPEPRGPRTPHSLRPFNRSFLTEESAVFVDPLAPAAIATGIHSELNEYRSQSLPEPRGPRTPHSLRSESCG